MSSEKDASVTSASQDLLSAALNQSGLMMLDSPGSTYSDETESNQDPLSALGLLPPALEKPATSNGRKSHSPLTISQKPIEVKTPLPQKCKVSLKDETVVLASKPPPRQLISITKNGSKIFTVPLSKSDNNFKSNIIRLPLNLNQNGMKAPIIIKASSNSKSTIQPATSKLITVGIPKPCNTNTTRVAGNLFSTTTSTSSQPTRTPDTSSVSMVKTYAKVMVGNKKILIPIIKKNGVNSQGNRVGIPTSALRTTTQAVVSTVPGTTLKNSSVPLPVGSVANTHTNLKRVSPTLNLGSLFVETAEKEVTRTLYNSRVPVMSNPVYVGPSVPSSVMSDSNNNFGVIKKPASRSIPQNIFYRRDCISPLSPVADILSALTNSCSQSPLAMSSSTTHAQSLISSMAATVATIGGNQINIKHPPYKKQYSQGSIAGKKGDVARLPSISRSQSVITGDSFYKTSKAKSARDFTGMNYPENSNQNKKATDDLVEEEERVEEEIQHASTYAEYVPSKLNLGLPHPDSVVETSSLSSVPPPDVYYKLSIPDETINNGSLSALQLEAITYSCQKNETILPTGERAGFLIGDGAGVGKGRTIAGIIFENYILGKKRALWFSVSNDLKYDAERDLKDIGAKSIHVHIINKFKYGKVSSRENGSVKKGVIFATYSSLIAESHFNTKYGTRLKQILQWCGKDFDGVIVFDECHKAKNLIPSGSAKPTKTGYTVLELQKRLPNARVIYASATGASEPRNMAYMSRLGLWGSGTPFLNFMDFIQAVERRGVGAMEMVAMDLKARGSYIARQLSFHGVSFKIHEVPLTRDFIKMYNAAVRLWVAAKEAFQTAAGLIDAEHHMKKTMWGQFWAAHQRFFKYLCIASKVNHTSQIAREAVKHGKCVVIGLQSTGESRTLDQVEKCAGELDDFVSTARGVFENLIEHHFPAPNRKRVTDLFGKDFYKFGKDKDDGTKENGKKKRKIDPDEKDKQPASKKFHPNKKDSDGDNSSEDEEQDDLKPYFSDDSLNYSDEDIGKIFGGGSDSEEWGADSVSGSAKKARKQKKAKKDSSDEDEEADRLLEMAGLKPSSTPNVKEPAAEEKEKSNLANFQTLENGAETSGLLSLNRLDLGPVERAQALKQELLSKLTTIALPNNTLDELIDALGGPENVAEMTGRKGRVVSTDEGNIQYESRSENDVRCDMLNLTEKQRFMDGEKNIAIISEAASSGISLQSDRRARNQRRRLHITLELPWSADRAIQQFGRTHRSNQVNAPEYVFLISELAGEQRFASVVAKRLESLGALTHGDRRATETRDLSQYNFDNKFGRIALESIMKSIAKIDFPLVQPPATYPGLFFKDIREAMIGVGLVSLEGPNNQPQLEKEYNNIVKFMNRILGMEVMQQNAVFQYFTSTLSEIINRAKSQGQFDQGILDVGNGEECVERLSCRKFVVKRSGSPNQEAASGYIELHTVKLERGLSWDEAEKIWSENCSGEHDGFYLTQLKRNGKFMAVLGKEKVKSRKRWVPPEDSSTGDNQDDSRLFTLHRPNTGKQIKAENLKILETRYRRVEPGEAENWWRQQYDASIDQCSHAYWQGFCNRRVKGMPCSIGRRCRVYHVLSGSVLAVWRLVEKVLSVGTSSLYKMQIVRLKTKDGGKLVGLLIPSNCLSNLIGYLTNPDHVANNSSFSNPTGNAGFVPTFSAMQGSNMSALVRSSSSPSVSNMFDTTLPSVDVELSDEGSFEDVEEEVVDEKFSPDEMVSSVLFPKQKKYSWMT